MKTVSFKIHAPGTEIFFLQPVTMHDGKRCVVCGGVYRRFNVSACCANGGAILADG